MGDGGAENHLITNSQCNYAAMSYFPEHFASERNHTVVICPQLISMLDFPHSYEPDQISDKNEIACLINLATQNNNTGAITSSSLCRLYTNTIHVQKPTVTAIFTPTGSSSTGSRPLEIHLRREEDPP